MGKRPREAWPLNEEQKALVAENYRLACKFARTHQPPIGMDQDDWNSECLHRLCVCASSYDKNIGPFSTYAYASMIRHRWHLYAYATYERRDIRKTQRLGKLGSEIPARDESDWRGMVEEAREWLAMLQTRERFVVRLYTGGKTLAEIGREMGLSRERVRQIYERALKRIRAQLKVG